MNPARDPSAARQLFDRELPSGYLAEWTAYYATPLQSAAAATESAVVFRLGAEWLGLPTAVFREVVAWRAIHSLPHRRSAIVLGLANVRGELLIGVSLADLLGIEKIDDDKKKTRIATRRLLVIAHEDSRVVFPADEVHGTLRFRPSDTRDVPATVTKATATYTRAMLPWQDRTVGLLNERLLFETLNRNFA